ncbi:MAG: PspC domain-containing protein [Acidimicrobiia bacterium]|nr:PspC domain-containing protein [Acidimicrobiia bacterium]
MDTGERTTEEDSANPGLLDRVRRFVVRRPTDRVILGLAGGIADRVGVPDAYVRAAFVSLSLAGGAGIILYLIGSAIAIESDEEPAEPAAMRQVVALSLLFLGLMVFFRGLDLWFGDSVVWSGTLLAFGGAAMWDRTNLFDATESGIAPSRMRIAVGALLLLAGFASFSSGIDAIESMGPAVTAAALTAAGFTIIFGPWVTSLARDLSEERRNRIRSDERSDMAAHLHDSVLQTLALIQRSDDPKRMVTLARAQERDLRNWLYGSEDGTATGLRQALQNAAGSVEAKQDVPVEVVIVGDMPLAAGSAALVAATGEAMTNAAKHSGATKVSVFAEVREDAVEVFVTDQGTGFDKGQIDPDRHGIVDSIQGRMKRHGGEAEITSEPGEGTEVRLMLPRGTHD